MSTVRPIIIVAALTLAGCASTGTQVRDPRPSPDGDIPGESLALATGPVLPRPEGPVPIRTPAQVMRVWIAPWEDSRGDLHAPGYLYSEIEPRRWTLGAPPAGNGERRITPLQIEPREGSQPAFRPGPETERSSTRPGSGKSPASKVRQS